MNPIIILTRNNLHLTQAAVESLRAQDITGGVQIIVVDNHSTDNTPQWLATQKDIITIFNQPANSVAGAWNQALSWLFTPKWLNASTPTFPAADYALVVNNDVLLRPDTYRHLVNDGGLFVTAVGTRDADKINPQYEAVEDFGGCLLTETVVERYADPDPAAKRPHPDFSCMLIRREAWEQVGPFDEGFKGAFCEDGDYDLRMFKAGIRAYCLDLPYLHYGSMTVKNARPAEQKRIQDQAARNREYFRKKWGFPMGSEEYYRALDKGGPVEELQSIP